MYRIYASYIGVLGLSSHYLPQTYATREEASKAALLRNCKPYCPYFFRVE